MDVINTLLHLYNKVSRLYYICYWVARLHLLLNYFLLCDIFDAFIRDKKEVKKHSTVWSGKSRFDKDLIVLIKFDRNLKKDSYAHQDCIFFLNKHTVKTVIL